MITDNFTVNQPLSAPGLAIHGAASALVKYANAFHFRANGRISPSVAGADAPSLSGATLNAPYPNGVAQTAGNLATAYSRIYALIATLPSGASPTPTFSWIAGPDFLTSSDQPASSDISFPLASNQTVVGTVTIANATGSAFVPGTTALDTAGLTVTYQDNFGVSTN